MTIIGYDYGNFMIRVQLANFRETRVPVQTLLDYLEAGDSIDEFLAGFPSVTRAQVIAFLEAAKN